MTEYARPELLAETDWLAERLGDPSIRIVDCDEFPAYGRMHIDGAIGIKVHHYLKDEGGVHLMGQEQFKETMASHGIDSGHTVIAYDSSGGLYAARLWWALDYYGHTACKLLNGGFRKWFLEGRPVSMQQPHVDRAEFRAKAPADTICSLQDMKAATRRDDVLIWDVRAPAEYTGEDPRQNKRGGHIPGAVNMEWLELTAPPTRSGLLLPADDIKRKLESAGITPDKVVYTH
jgi:thiosulfate/3-mercaptopyruvate sulfurtransferase